MSHPFTDRRLRELSAGYDLDYCDHGFEVWDDVGILPGVVWDPPYPESVPWILGEDRRAGEAEFRRLRAPVYVFAPSHDLAGQGDVAWPETFDRPCLPGGHYRLLRQGQLLGTDKYCTCLDLDYEANPGCPRCHGGGTVIVDGGCWALYAWEESEAPA